MKVKVEVDSLCAAIALAALETRFAVRAKSIPHAAGTTLSPYSLLLTPYSLLLTPYSLLFTPYSLPQNSHRPHLFLAAVIAFAEPDFVGVNALVHEFAAVSAVPFKINAGAVEE